VIDAWTIPSRSIRLPLRVAGFALIFVLAACNGPNKGPASNAPVDTTISGATTSAPTDSSVPDSANAATNTPTPPSAQFTDDLAFTDYKADPYNGPVAHPDFAGKQKSYAQFRTRISDSVNGGVNFGGSLAIAEFGCGAECLMGFVTDLQTGTVYDLPAGGEDNPELSLIYKPDSNLLLAQWTGGPDMDHPTCVHAFFQWTGGAFTPLQKREVQGQCPTPQ
jgi:hypothetical protein